MADCIDSPPITPLSPSSEITRRLPSSIGERHGTLGSASPDERGRDGPPATASGVEGSIETSCQVQESRDCALGTLSAEVCASIVNVMGTSSSPKARGSVCFQEVIEEDSAEEAKRGSVFEAMGNQSSLDLNGDGEFLGNGKVSAGLLEIKKQQLLNDLEGGSIFREVARSEFVTDESPAIDVIGVATDGNKISGELVYTCDDMEGKNGIDGSLGRSLKIQVIDDTALIEPLSFPGIVNGGECSEGNANKNAKEVADVKKTRGPRRKGKGAKRDNLVLFDEPVDACRTEGDGTIRRYLREEMEALRFVNISEQPKFWRKIYDGLGPVAREYANLASSKHWAQSTLSYHCQRQSLGRAQDPGILGEGCKEQVGVVLENTEDSETNCMDLDPACGQNISCEDVDIIEEGGEEDSDNSYEYFASIQRPAFLVEGEPNFDSGPPEDGLEFLRRVRWEAAQIPNVKVAKLDQSKLHKEQSTYMPVIPEIAKCPEHLMPLKQWEDAFLEDFSMLRRALSSVESASAEISGKLHSLIKVVQKYPVQHPKSNASEILNDCQTAREVDEAVLNPGREYLGSEKSEDPMLFTILGMDSVARVSMLRKRIDSVEAASLLSRNDCLWLFALCAAVDTPLDSNTCASLRSLLRKCASLRAQKAEMDGEVIMLNILATISGRYFGQSEN
ncbi:uncharacterized protein LOC115739304 isoform X2 [Rhodamnia argentea]|uniref:Uncharacterized protein LOC115739304 isoform X2 n=1 Tax=Rhodamnia argentea TaxID=178133 RepID=A0A8B8P2U2_9MYRT|nr:uncharacterized protein LOC115739304 isoform X2 [Rhodamnia argentea]